jgi:capsular polysaccharide biosynthesis protein
MERIKKMNQLTENRRGENEEMEIDLLEVFYYLKARIVWLALAFVIGAVLFGSVTMLFITPKYQATSKVYMVSASSDSIVDLTDLNIGTSLSTDYVELLKLRPVLEDVIEQLDLEYTYDELLGMISIGTVGDSRLMAITVTSTKPKEAKEIANKVADLAVTYVPDIMETAKPNIAEYAIVPEQKSSPSLSKNTILGGLVAFVLLAAVFVVQLLLDDTFKSAEDVEKLLGVMPLTVIPEGNLETIDDKAEKHIRDKKRKERRKRKGKKQDAE